MGPELGQVRAYSVMLACFGFDLPQTGSSAFHSQRAGAAAPAASIGPSPFEDDSFESVRAAAQIANVSRVRMSRQRGRRVPVTFDGAQVVSVGIAVGRALRESGAACHACVVMPDHLHLVVSGIDEVSVRALAERIKQLAFEQLADDGLLPLELEKLRGRADCSQLWSDGIALSPLSDEASVRVAIAYVEQSPDVGRLPRQRWGFVQ